MALNFIKKLSGSRRKATKGDGLRQILDVQILTVSCTIAANFACHIEDKKSLLDIVKDRKLLTKIIHATAP
jgi:hypothetical protein